MALAQIGAADDPGSRTGMPAMAEDDIGELLVLEAALGALREPMRPAPREPRREVAPVALVQRARVVVRAGRERRAAGGR